MGYRDKEKKRMADKAYREKNKEKLKIKSKEYYQKNKEAIIQKSKKYAQENSKARKNYLKGYHEKSRLEVSKKIDPAMKCANCGCDDPRFLEINHIKGGGNQEHKKRGKNVTRNMILLIYLKKRGIEDLNILCKICNALDYLERKYGHTRLRVVWDKPVTNPPVPSLDQVLQVSKNSKNS